MDAWKQTEYYSQLKGDIYKRLAVAYRRSSRSMLSTSSTTTAAFIATGFSDIMPISSFGYFAGIMVAFNFLLVISFYPCIMIIWERYVKNRCCPPAQNS